MKGMIISASPSTANTPRAHIINAAAFGKYVDSHLPDHGPGDSAQ